MSIRTLERKTTSFSYYFEFFVFDFIIKGISREWITLSL